MKWVSGMVVEQVRLDGYRYVVRTFTALGLAATFPGRVPSRQEMDEEIAKCDAICSKTKCFSFIEIRRWRCSLTKLALGFLLF